MFRVGFAESLKSTLRFSALVLLNFGFNRLRQFLFAKFAVGFVDFQNQRVFFLQNFWQVKFVKFCRLVVESAETFFGVVVFKAKSDF